MGREVVDENDPGWVTPCPVEPEEILVLLLRNGSQAVLWFCLRHVKELSNHAGPHEGRSCSGPAAVADAREGS